MSDSTVYFLTFVSMLLSPLFFLVTKNFFWVYANIIILIVFFFSWFWALHYKLTPEVYFPEVLFSLSIVSSTVFVWISSYVLMKKWTDYKKPKTTAMVFGLISCIVSLMIDGWPADLNSLSLVYGQFHLLFISLMIVTAILTKMVKRGTLKKNGR